MSKKRKIVTSLLMVLSVLFMVAFFAYGWINRSYQGDVRTCTVQKASLVHENNNGAPFDSVEVETTECGEITITKVKHPKNTNHAKLAEVLNAHQGEKFEFFATRFQLDTDGFDSTGVTSLDPVK